MEVSKGNFIQIKVGSTFVPLPDPNFGSGNFTITTNVNEGRNGTGNFVGSVVGSDKYKVELNWSLLPAEDATILFGYFNRKKKGKFVNTFRVFDARYNKFTELDYYVSDRTGTPLMVKNGNAKYYKDVRIALIQV